MQLLRHAGHAWSFSLTHTFYHVTVIPMLLVTVVLAWLARPATKDELPRTFGRFQTAFLAVWSICVMADWLQGPFVYALYEAYGFNSAEIAQLFVVGFASSLVFGCFVGALMDRFGRKSCCLAYCVLYILSCMTKHFQNYPLLMFGRVTGGIATSLLFSCFECWMVSEHTQRHGFPSHLLGYMFGMMFTTMYCVAIASGVLGQLAADQFALTPVSEGSMLHFGGYCTPFDLSIVCLLMGIVLILWLWEENYGSDGGLDAGGVGERVVSACRLFFRDKRMMLLCIIVASFEGSMYAFVFNWTPALTSELVPPPHGLIFSLFMMACMCGASVSTLLGGMMRPDARLLLVFAVATAAFGAAASVAGGTAAPSFLKTSFAAFLLFEFCVGVYFPSIGVLKSEIVPESIRGTMYNIYRIPLNGLVVILLLGNFSLSTSFKLCAGLVALSLLSIAVVSSKILTPPKQAEVDMIGKTV
eukprot:CAMPEP_0170614394 /NCGR_PEP_ID=MMETSP0224-20130122/24778_1 /TAXON_ID=285029 /ORGANISM="Togula jolla, Strain CCCM 725" /LENGTH=470 /DNA_ID=CAMNT_0010940051 /DNA_START=73 /DNA_END=1485 /DNA_ORIENTATION=-